MFSVAESPVSGLRTTASSRDGSTHLLLSRRLLISPVLHDFRGIREYSLEAPALFEATGKELLQGHEWSEDPLSTAAARLQSRCNAGKRYYRCKGGLHV